MCQSNNSSQTLRLVNKIEVIPEIALFSLNVLEQHTFRTLALAAIQIVNNITSSSKTIIYWVCVVLFCCCCLHAWRSWLGDGRVISMSLVRTAI